jgi:D-amino-acid dehydrogenase
VKAEDLRDVLVLGGGAIGVCTAFSLAERGLRVALVERGQIGSGCSHGNAGWIFPSHSMPLPAPGAIRRGLRWMLDPESPLYIRPRPSLALARWLWNFRRACREPAMRRTYAIRRELSLASLELYAKLAALPDLAFGFTRKGVLIACRTEAGLRDLEHEVALLEAAGGEATRLDGAGLREHYPSLAGGLPGGARFPADAHLNPGDFVRGLGRELERRGVAIHLESEVLEIEWRRTRGVRLLTTRGELRGEELVLAAGAWSSELARSLGLSLPVESAKGYSLTARRPEGTPELPVMLAEAKVFVTPMGEHLRFGGTLELAGLDLRVNLRRVRAIERAVPEYLPGLPTPEVVETWRGLRPLTPDDLPIIGRPAGTQGLVLATGHGMTGISHAPITGELVAQLLCGEPTSLDLAPFSPDRF